MPNVDVPWAAVLGCCCAVLQYGTIDFTAVAAELPVERDAEGAFLAIPGLPQ